MASFLLQHSKEFRRKLEDSRPRLYRMAFAWSHNPPLAEDLVQEALAKALRHTAQLRDIKTMDAWLFRILANCWRDYFRRNRIMEDIDDLNLTHNVTPESLHNRNEVINEILLAVSQLSEGQRQVTTLVDLEGFSYMEVADILAVPIGTVMSRLCRARKTLKKLLVKTQTCRSEQPASTSIRRVK
ncbi:MAG TPA: RNA polymerase sigma factor [Acidiferrobacteraceae bacterium]|nr:RNA polymerase sigma factor [Acidiferrobacteraceae bacterium]